MMVSEIDGVHLLDTELLLQFRLLFVVMLCVLLHH